MNPTGLPDPLPPVADILVVIQKSRSSAANLEPVGDRPYSFMPAVEHGSDIPSKKESSGDQVVMSERPTGKCIGK